MSTVSGTRKTWIVAASIGAVEAMKDQGVCRWNYVLRRVQQDATNNLIRSNSQSKNVSSSSSSAISDKTRRKSEDSMRKVMDLSCLGPSTVRF